MRYIMALLSAVLICIGSPVLAQSSQAKSSAKKPNVLFVLVDNLGWGEIGAYGGGELRGAPTPHLDNFATQGMKLLNFNVEPQCTPSRSAIMTGRFPIRSGTTRVVWGLPYGLVGWEVTMAETFKQAGYATAMFGKWHLGEQKGRYPTDQGFDIWYGIPNTTDELQYTEQLFFDPKWFPRPLSWNPPLGKPPQRSKITIWIRVPKSTMN